MHIAGMNKSHILYLLLILLLPACNSIPSVYERTHSAEQLAASHGWQAHQLKTGVYHLSTFHQDPMPTGKTVVIYIEGDGLAWVSMSRPSSNPTPINPVALKLALTDPHDGPVAYLGRPCQYVEDDENCKQTAWTGRRFSFEVIEASSKAIDQLKRQAGANKVRLIGFSGGGAVAALLAAQRDDVEILITVAGNLDHRTWTEHHHITPLSGSQNASDAWQALQHIPQVHFIGGQDKSVPPLVAYAYRSRFPSSSKPRIQLLPEYSHHCCWVNDWPRLVRSALEESDSR